MSYEIKYALSFESRDEVGRVLLNIARGLAKAGRSPRDLSDPTSFQIDILRRYGAPMKAIEGSSNHSYVTKIRSMNDLSDEISVVVDLGKEPLSLMNRNLKVGSLQSHVRSR